MCNNSHWNIAQTVPDCQLKMRPLQGQQKKLKADWKSESWGGSAERRLIKAASDGNCQQFVAVVGTMIKTAHWGGTEVDWEENHWLFHSKLKAGIWSPDVRSYHRNEEKNASCSGPVLPLINLTRVYKTLSFNHCSVSDHVMLKRCVNLKR